MDSNQVMPQIFINSSGPRTLIYEMGNPFFNMTNQQGQMEMLHFVLECMEPLHQAEIKFHSAYFSMECADSYVGSPAGETQTFFFKDRNSHPMLNRQKDGRDCTEMILPDFSLSTIAAHCIEVMEKSTFSCEPDEFTGWSSFHFNSLSFHLDDPVDQLSINYGPGRTHYQVGTFHTEMGCTVGGPSGLDAPTPIDLYIKNEGYKITIVAHLIWSYFFDPLQKGTVMIDAWSKSLVEKGFVRLEIR